MSKAVLFCNFEIATYYPQIPPLGQLILVLQYTGFTEHCPEHIKGLDLLIPPLIVFGLASKFEIDFLFSINNLRFLFFMI